MALSPFKLQKPDLSVFPKPPYSAEAEEAVLAGLLLDNSTFDEVADLLIAEDFYQPENLLIYTFVCSLLNEQKIADFVTIYEIAQRDHRVKNIDVFGQHLRQIVDAMWTTGNIRQYAQIIKDKATLRHLTKTGLDIAHLAGQPSSRSLEEIINETEQRLTEVIQNSRHKSDAGLVKIENITSSFLEYLCKLSERAQGTEVTGMPTGFIDLDRKISGLHSGELIIIAGRPAMGKTAFALNIALNVAAASNKRVAIFTLEMGSEQLVMRLLSSQERINQQALRTGHLSRDDMDKVFIGLRKLANCDLYIDETSGLTFFDLRSRVRKLARQSKEGLGLVVVDYLQLLSLGHRTENRTAEISEISRNLKLLSKELNCPIIALSQLNRELERRPDKRPIVSDLRESGAIEQDADLILMLYRDEVYHPESPDKGTAELIIGKHRNGPTGKIKLTFLGEYTRFENHATESNYYADYD